MQTDTSNKFFQIALEFIQYTNRSIFLTGKAGTGKTTFLKYIREHSNKNMVVVAPTGVAAINAGGVTIHSFFQLPFNPFLANAKGFNDSNEAVLNKHQLLAKVKLNKTRIEIIQKLDLLVIDEISMVRCDVLDAIDTVLKHYRSNHKKPFGGVQVLFIGDMFQLPPVAKNIEWQVLSQHYNSTYFFDSDVVKEIEPAYVELNKIYRQNDDVFIGLLNKIRHSQLDENAFELLQSLYNPTFQPTNNKGFITLTTHNARAEAINNEALQTISNSSFYFKATIEGDFGEKIFPIDEVLEFKLGAQVMFVKNDLDKEKRFYNGKIGVIEKLSNEEIWVKCTDDNDLIKVERYTWENIIYQINPSNNQIEEEVIGKFIQYPLRLAWAITIHKSQGLTFDKAIIDAGSSFASGQVYVALSRCRSLDGIVLLSKITNQNLIVDFNIQQFEKIYKNNHLESNLTFEKHLHQTEILKELFDFEFEINIVNKLYSFVIEQANSFNKSTIEFLDKVKTYLQKQYKVGRQFILEIDIKNDGNIVPEQNQHLQERFIKATSWFANELSDLLLLINTSTALTNNKEFAKTYDDDLKKIYSASQFKLNVYKALNEGFNFNTYQFTKKTFTASGLTVSANAKKIINKFSHPTHPFLYNELQAFRDDYAEQVGEQSFMILNNKTLDELATYLPQTKKDLEKIGGFGKVKIKQFGTAILQIIIEYCLNKNIDSNMHNITLKKQADDKPKVEKLDTFFESYKLFKEGKTVNEIVEIRNLKVDTIYGHLCRYILKGDIAITELITLEKTTTLLKALEGYEPNLPTAPIINKLGSEYSYSEVKMAIAHLGYIKSKEEN